MIDIKLQNKIDEILNSAAWCEEEFDRCKQDFITDFTEEENEDAVNYVEGCEYRDFQWTDEADDYGVSQGDYI